MQFAASVRGLREGAGLTVSAMAEKWGVDERTYRKYEKGLAAPNIVDYCCIVDSMGIPVLKPILNFLHPDRFASGDGDIAQIRESLALWAEKDAPDRVLRQVYYNLVGQAADNIAPQLELISALQHLPLIYRVMVVRMVLGLYEMAENRGELVNMEHVPPDIDALKVAAARAEAACKQMQDSYLTVTAEL